MSENEAFRRDALAGEIADLVFRQSLIVSCDEVFAVEFPDQIGEKFAEFLSKDRRDLGLLQTAQTNLGVRVDPKDSAMHVGEFLSSVARDDSLTPMERIGVYSLLRQCQMMAGHIVHKASQHAALDVKEALAVLVPVQSDFAKRNAEVFNLYEEVGTFMLTGEEAERGVLGRLRDMGAAVVGAVANRSAKPAEEMSILVVLRMDHMKVKTLFREIEAETAPDRVWVLYRQIYNDLMAHSKAEEQVVYQKFAMDDEMESFVAQSQQEHEELRRLLDDMETTSPGSSGFDTFMRELKHIVNSHVEREEDELFKMIRERCDKEELVRLSASFAKAKEAIQATLPTLTEPEGGMSQPKTA